jgi:aspartyl-tRNA(Asn)/glutamyl-tRNA(Gln) amidotransferase subunit A
MSASAPAPAARPPLRPLAEGGPWTALIAPGPDAAGVPPEGAPLAGLVVGVKELIAVAGLPQGAGSRGFPARVASHDAAVVALLRAAGATIRGTTATHELGLGVTGINDWAGTPGNPRVAGAITGGSSSGSAAAVADGSCDVALGTDTGGSVRIPASLCGVVGFKPHRLCYPIDGVVPLAPSLDHVGVLARDVGVVLQVHTTLGGRGGAPAPRVVGIDEAAIEASDPHVARRLEAVVAVVEMAGFVVRPVVLPDADEVREASTVLLLAEAHREHGHRIDHLGADVAARLRVGAAVGPEQEQAARRARRRISEALRQTLSSVDLVLGPTTPTTAPSLADARADADLGARLVAHTRLANLCGTPALTLPLPDGPPCGLQLQGGRDEDVLAAGVRFARLLG